MSTKLSTKLRNEYLVYGYLKEMTKQQNLEQNIPDGIKSIITSFYYIPPMIIDRGSGSIKAGLAGNQSPDYEIPSIVARPKSSNDKLTKAVYFGKSAKDMPRGHVSRKYPIEHGIVTNWDDMERLFRYTFEEAMKCIAKGSTVLTTEHPLNPKANREKSTQIMFETFQVAKYLVKADAVLALYGAGILTGVAVSSGL